MTRIAGSLATPLPTHESNLAASFRRRVGATPDREAFRAPTAEGGWRSFTWREVGVEVETLAAGLVSLGVAVGDRVAIASNTRLEWILVDFAIMCAGGANMTIYPSTGAEDVGFMLADSGAAVLVAEDAGQVAKATAQLGELPELRRIVVIDGPGDGDRVISLAEVRSMGEAALAQDPQVVTQRVEGLTGESLATLIYTSGTTGRPKGVELPHRCWVFEGASIDAIHEFTADDVLYLWLPMSHSFGKVLTSVALQIGFATAVDGRVARILENLAVIQPTAMAGVPRIFEKIYAAANDRARAAGGTQAKLYDWAFATSSRVRQARREGRRSNPFDLAQQALAHRLVISKIKALTGGRIRFFICGSAALNSDVAHWFDAAEMPILEGYGLTETSAAATLVRPSSIAFGSVGQPIPGTEAMLADDGEILLRGPHVMRGYRNSPEDTAKVLGPEGWLATGDIGTIDELDRLRITDRKKDLVKTSNGKYIAPGAIEAQFKALNSLASNLIVHANNRKFASALVTLDPDALRAFAAERGLHGDFAALSQSPEVRADIQGALDQLNEGLNHWETIKKFTILDRDLSEADGELTASMKVRRKAVEDHFAAQLDAMYA